MIEIRPCTIRAEEERSLAIYNAVWPWDAQSMQDVDAFKAEAIAYVDLLALLDGRPIGSGAAAVRRRRPSIAFTMVTVLPSDRARGAGSALYRAISDWGHGHGLEALDAIAPAQDAVSIAFGWRRGFVEVERNGLFVLDLAAAEAPAVDPPAGIEIASWAERPDLALGIYEVAREAYADIPGRPSEALDSFDHWLEHEMNGPADRPEATFLALAGDEVVGYGKLTFTTAQPAVAFHGMTGVRRDWRGRGVAGALKRAQVAWAKRAGFARMQAENEARNEPIRRLNERLGYRPAPGEVVLRGPLSQ